MKLLTIQQPLVSLSFLYPVSSMFSKNLGYTATQKALSQPYTKGKITTHQPWYFYIGNGTKEDSEPNGNKTVKDVYCDVVERAVQGRSVLSKHHACLQGQLYFNLGSQ
jgi:hypothetical protein